MSIVFRCLLVALSCALCAALIGGSSPRPHRVPHTPLEHLAETIARADHAVVYHLDPDDPAAMVTVDDPHPERIFAITNEGGLIRARRALDHDGSQALLEALSDLLYAPPGDQAACHEPRWGVEVYAADGTQIFRSSLCFACSNYEFFLDGNERCNAMPAGSVKAHLKNVLTACMDP
jgi:hypothetical protein